MRAGWESVRTALVSTITTLDAEQDFRKYREPETALRRFESPSALVSYLTSPSGDLDKKDEILRALLHAVQGRANWSELAMSLLWLGLWPALDHVYRRRRHLFSSEADDPVSAIGSCFTAAVQSADDLRIEQLAATLKQNTDRRLMDELRREWNHAKREKPYEDDRLQAAADRAQERAGLDVPPQASEALTLAELRARLLPVVGEDTDLLIAVLVQGENQREAAGRLGIGHAAARKRYQRALRQAGSLFRTDLSHSAPKDRVSLGKGTRPSPRERSR
jgi:hypothetical protein